MSNHQVNLFEYVSPQVRVDKPIRLIENFGGIGATATALRRLGADFEHYRLVEFDKYAILSYNAVHGTNFPVMDITEIKGEDLGIVETDKYDYIMSYSFCCQDLSLAGKQAGMDKGSGTRSSLLWEVERLLNEITELPQVLLLENVPQLIGDKNIGNFRKWIRFLAGKGYSNYYELLNAKNYGVAQNRDRCFMVSILGDYSYNFPKPIPLKKRMKDYLECEVAEKYYINNDRALELIEKLRGTERGHIPNISGGAVVSSALGSREHRSSGWSDIVGTLCARDYKDPKVVAVKEIGNYMESNHEASRVVDTEGIAPTVKENHGTVTAILEKQEEPKIVVEQVGNIVNTGNWENSQRGRIYSSDGLCPSLNTVPGGGLEPKIIEPVCFNSKVDGKQPSLTDRVYDINAVACAITTSQFFMPTYLVGEKEPVIVTSRGRNKKNPSDRTQGIELEQRLEPNSEGICNTLTSVQKDNLVLEPAIKKIDIPQTVKIRKYEVDIEKLKEVLKSHKNSTNREIAIALNKPITLVEHWFRKDNSFSIPDADVWHQLKELLGIKTNEFDLSITEFIERDGVYEKANRCYMVNGLSPTITSATADEKILEPTIKIKQATKQGYIECKPGGVADLSYPTSELSRGRVQGGGDICPALIAGNPAVHRIETPYRIRKLTPKECWKLMSFTDEEFHRAEKVCSSTQLYKQAGNSIVVDVLVGIFGNLNIKGCPNWEEYTKEKSNG